ncbi:unnamed protein product [Cochlearia groenlandica]
MEVLAGSRFEIGTEAHDKALLVTEESSGGLRSRIGLRRCVLSPPEKLSESSSSVGNEEEEEDDAVSSKGRWIDSFSSSLEDSLPIKRGLSKHYIGKSKSFGNLMEANNAKDLEKLESPLNKRRRLLIANKLRRRSSLSSFSFYNSKTNNPNSMPLLALQESDEEDDKYNYDNGNDDDSIDEEASKLQEKRMKMTNNNRDFRIQSQSCFCLTSFQDDDRGNFSVNNE